MRRQHTTQERLMLWYCWCWVLPGGPPEGRAGLPRLFQLVIQHDCDMEEHPLQLYNCHGESSLQLQHHLSHLSSVLRQRRLEVSCRDGMGDYAEDM